MTDVYLIGVGMSRFAAQRECSLVDLSRIALDEALADAGVARAAIQIALFGNATQGALEGQHAIRGQIVLRALGLPAIPVINVENACATGSTALHLAVQQVKSGAVEVALALGAEKMVIEDKARALALFDAGWDIHHREQNIAELAGGYFDTQALRMSANDRRRSLFMDLYALMARHHMETYGTTQRHLAAVAHKNHFHSTLNPKAQYQQAFSVEEILAAPLIAAPLTLPMCAPLSDGAAAAIVASKKFLARHGRRDALKVLASVLRCGSPRDARDYAHHVCRLAAQSAYEEAGIGAADIQVAEVHDAAAFGEIIQTECLGFCPPGGGGELAESGATRLGGRIPVNTSGGLESKGHPLGATGLGQIYELALQLRGRADQRQVAKARFAIAENGGGLIGVEEAVTAITILARE